ncbi:WcbI family polysaccharide biosynthesis putative acetyltransferase [Desulfovibrio litoralis]|uniref:Polysaccharide biosynthesis enzyme WcbI domain-containing protein n=1 Tax=Desulfovibrio litoralis DSM 11393 TaxID=1121455 RepID=A0A1M7TIW0_9BACT|nr:WcbI family polysaccharide biosynthesis putative acetyltransferase [Desulfovibrio litoralis]SHN70626.1 hypothetical protein SAMN02745728_02064 [Desulfovibrio litoralis DSM 11393]
MKKTKKICILHANCQGEEYQAILDKIPAFTDEWNLKLFTNYTKQAIPQDLLPQADLFLYQYLDNSWGDLSSDVLLKQLKKNTAAFCLPAVFFRGFHPFWEGRSEFHYYDNFLEKLIASGAEKSVILRLYLQNDLRNKLDLNAHIEFSFSREEEKEKSCDFKVMPFIRKNWQDRQLLYTVSHPNKVLCRYLVENILNALNIALPDELFWETHNCTYNDFEQPIHPQLIDFYKLKFITPETTFNVYGRQLSFAQYISRYIDCRQNNIDNFIGYLHFV